MFDYTFHYSDDSVLVANQSCEVDQANQFCLGSIHSCFHLVNSNDCKPNGKAVYIKCGMYIYI